MTFQILNIPNGQSALAGLVLYNSRTITIQKKLGLSSVGFYKKKFDLYIN